MRILIIEDNKDIMDIIEYILTDSGYEVVCCPDGTCIQNLGKIKPDLILIDELLPTVRGSQLCEQIKSTEEYKHIPVVIISAIQSLESIASKCKADAYVEKPFNIDELKTLIERLTA